jgi:hypothetical protein
MKKITNSIIGVIFIMTIPSIMACHQSTRVEKDVVVGPEGSVSQETTVDKEVTTGIEDKDIKVETKVDTH